MQFQTVNVPDTGACFYNALEDGLKSQGIYPQVLQALKAQLAEKQKTYAGILRSIYTKNYAFPEWVLTADWSTYKFSSTKVYFSDLNAYTQVQRLTLEREPCNIGMNRFYDQVRLKNEFGWVTGAYAESTPEKLMPNLAIYTEATVKLNQGFVPVHVINLIGYAFDRITQPDYQYFYTNGFDKVVQHYEKMWMLAFAAAKDLKQKNRIDTIRLFKVGGGYFADLYPGGKEAFYQKVFVPSFAKAARFLSQAGIKIIDFKEFFSIPDDLQNGYNSRTLYVNAWDPWSMIGNGNASDPSIDGGWGSVSNMAVLGWRLTNPYMSYVHVRTEVQTVQTTILTILPDDFTMLVKLWLSYASDLKQDYEQFFELVKAAIKNTDVGTQVNYGQIGVDHAPRWVVKVLTDLTACSDLTADFLDRSYTKQDQNRNAQIAPDEFWSEIRKALFYPTSFAGFFEQQKIKILCATVHIGIHIYDTSKPETDYTRRTVYLSEESKNAPDTHYDYRRIFDFQRIPPAPAGLDYTNWLLFPRLLGGSYPTHDNLKILQIQGFSYIVDLTERDEAYFGDRQRYTGADLGKITRLSFSIPDIEAPANDIAAWNFCHEIYKLLLAGHKIYLHCVGGRGRTSIIAGTILLFCQFTYVETIAWLNASIKTRRNQGKFPNPVVPESPTQYAFLQRMYAILHNLNGYRWGQDGKLIQKIQLPIKSDKRSVFLDLVKKLSGCNFETVVDIEGRIVETWNYTYKLRGNQQTLAEALTLLKQLNLVKINRTIDDAVLLLYEEELNQVECLFREFKLYAVNAVCATDEPMVQFTGDGDEFTFWRKVLLPIICNKKKLNQSSPVLRTDLLAMGSNFKLYSIIKDELFRIPRTAVDRILNNDKRTTIDYVSASNTSLINGPDLQELHLGLTGLCIPHVYKNGGRILISKQNQDKLYQNFSIYVNNRSKQSSIAFYMSLVKLFFKVNMTEYDINDQVWRFSMNSEILLALNHLLGTTKKTPVLTHYDVEKLDQEYKIKVLPAKNAVEISKSIIQSCQGVSLQSTKDATEQDLFLYDTDVEKMESLSKYLFSLGVKGFTGFRKYVKPHVQGILSAGIILTSKNKEVLSLLGIVFPQKKQSAKNLVKIAQVNNATSQPQKIAPATSTPPTMAQAYQTVQDVHANQINGIKRHQIQKLVKEAQQAHPAKPSMKINETQPLPQKWIQLLKSQERVQIPTTQSWQSWLQRAKPNWQLTHHDPWEQQVAKLLQQSSPSEQKSITQLERPSGRRQEPVTGVKLRKNSINAVLKQLCDTQQDVQAMSKRLRVIRASKRCACKTKLGKRCKNRAKVGTFFCYLHNACKLKRRGKRLTVKG